MTRRDSRDEAPPRKSICTNPWDSNRARPTMAVSTFPLIRYVIFFFCHMFSTWCVLCGGMLSCRCACVCLQVVLIRFGCTCLCVLCERYRQKVAQHNFVKFVTRTSLVFLFLHLVLLLLYLVLLLYRQTNRRIFALLPCHSIPLHAANVEGVHSSVPSTMDSCPCLDFRSPGATRCT